MAVLRGRLAAEQCGRQLELRGREGALDLTLGHQVEEATLVRPPVAFALLVLIEQLLRGSQKGLVLVGGADQLTEKVKDRLANRVDKRVFVKADARAKFGAVVAVVDNVRSAGVDQLGLLTDQKKQANTPAPAPPSGGQ